MTKKNIDTYIIDDDFTLEVVEDDPEIIEKAKIDTYLNASDSESELVIDEDADDNEKTVDNKPPTLENNVEIIETKSEIDTETDEGRLDDTTVAEIQEKITIVKNTKESIIKTNSAQFYKCPVCTRYVCKRKPKFLRHLDIHLSEHKLYKCEKCNFVCAEESYFSLHKIKCNAHGLKCHFCDFYTFKIRVMNKHVDMKHKKKKLKICNVTSQSTQIF